MYVIYGILHRKGYTLEGAQLLLVIPSHLQKEVLGSLYDDPTAEHLGVFKTYHTPSRTPMYASTLHHARHVKYAKLLPQPITSALTEFMLAFVMVSWLAQ